MKEISEATGESLQNLYRDQRRGLLPAIKFGRRIRFDAAQVLDFLESGGTAGDGNGGEDPS